MRTIRSAAMVALLAMTPAAAAFESASYDELIARARAGDYEPALRMMRAQEHDVGVSVTHDHIVIAGWAGRPAEVVDVFERLSSTEDVPENVLLTVARSYRDLKNWPEALRWFREGAKRQPAQMAFVSGEVMTLVDAGRFEDAIQAGQTALGRHTGDPDLELAVAYAYRRAGKPYDALFHTDRAKQSAPDRGYVQREYIFALQRARMADSALKYARQHAHLLDAGQMRELEADAAAELVRMAWMPTREESQRFLIADRALSRYEELIAAWSTLGPAAREDVVRVRIDRLSALHARMRMADVIREYEALTDEGIEVPAYALSDVAAAYLYERQPEKAAGIYGALDRQTGSEFNDELMRFQIEEGLYYSHAESEQFDEARKALEKAGPRYKPWVYYRGQEARVPNDLYLQKRQLEANALLGADDTRAAYHQFAEMVREAPSHTGLRADLATSYRARSLPRASERELKMAETLTPRSLAVENGQGFTAMDLQEWRQAEQLSRDTLSRYPEHLQTRRLAREWEVHNKPELRVSGYRGLANDSPVSGSGDFGIDAVLYSAPLNYNWRVFGGGGYGTGSFEEGDAHYRWMRTGVQWRGRDLTVEGEVSSHNYGYGSKPGVRLSAAYDLNDHWQVGMTGEILSREAPLRALNSDISVNSGDAYVRWRADERREWSLSVAASNFSDGNDRVSVDLAGRERLYTAPHLKIDGEMLVSSQRNSGDSEVPYFNPDSDLTALSGLRTTHTLYRRYETAWEQLATVAAGAYRQSGYGTGGIVSLGYGQRFRANDVLDMGFMVTGISRPYDGARERELRITFDLSYRF